MRVLLDTHVFLWWTSDNPNLSARAREVIANAENDVYLARPVDGRWQLRLVWDSSSLLKHRRGLWRSN